MLSAQELDWERQRQWREDRARRFAARVEEQRRLHELDPEKYSLLVPVDDDEFPDESYTAGWEDEEPEPGYVVWDADDSPDAADSEADDIDDGPTGELLIARSDLDLGYPVYPDDELGRDHHGCKVWGVFEVVEIGEEWQPELIRDEMTLAEAQKLTYELGARRVLGWVEIEEAN